MLFQSHGATRTILQMSLHEAHFRGTKLGARVEIQEILHILAGQGLTARKMIVVNHRLIVRSSANFVPTSLDADQEA
jgi:hypothetical protein